jgi:hypothetical protein
MPGMTKDELLERIRTAKAELDAVLAEIADDVMIGPHPAGEWSGKDQLAHLAAWQELLLARMRGIPEEDMLGFDPERYATMEIDEINAFLHDRDAPMSLDDARAAFGRTYAEVVGLLEAMDPATLEAPYRADLPDRPMMDAVVGDTYEHYEEHLDLLVPLTEVGD